MQQKETSKDTSHERRTYVGGDLTATDGESAKMAKETCMCVKRPRQKTESELLSVCARVCVEMNWLSSLHGGVES